MTPFDIANDLSFFKKDLIKDDPEALAVYNPWLINKYFSYHHDTIEYANYMNMYYQLDKELQSAFLINIVKKRKRFSKWHKNEKDKQLQAVMTYYDYSISKAKEIISILTPEQIGIIEQKVDESTNARHISRKGS